MTMLIMVQLGYGERSYRKISNSASTPVVERKNGICNAEKASCGKGRHAEGVEGIGIDTASAVSLSEPRVAGS